VSEDVLELLRKIRYDLTAAQGKLTDAIAAIAALNLPDASSVTCPTCGVHARGPNALAEHVHHSHAGPVPPAWLEAERLAGLLESEQT
jgi:hypothetical protein